jgi:hypothetical protein
LTTSDFTWFEADAWNFSILYNYVYIRPDSVSETLYHADRGWILSFTAIYMKWLRSGLRAAERHLFIGD